MFDLEGYCTRNKAGCSCAMRSRSSSREEVSGIRPCFGAWRVFSYYVSLQVKKIRFPISRVRLDGSIPTHDHERVQEMCKAGLDPMACVMVKLGYKFPINSTKEELFNLAG